MTTTVVAVESRLNVVSTDQEISWVQVGIQGPAGPSGAGGGDHGALTGLADDDHIQYHTDARGDARYAPLAHANSTANPHSVTAAQAGADATGTAAAAVSAHAGGASVHAIASITGLETALSGKSPTSHDHAATYAPIANGVTNGDSHDHLGGDGGQIAYTSLSGLPTLGGAAALNVGTITGTVAAGDDARLSDARAPTAHAHVTADVTGFDAAALAAAPAETVSTVGSLIAGATDKATPVDADTVALSDSESAGVLKKWSWANIKTSVTTALTGVFAKLSGVSGGQTLIGGTAATNKLDLQGTSANGTSTAAAVRLLVGNNGATVALEARNDGNVAIKAGGVSPQWPLDIGGYGAKTSLGGGTQQNVLALKGDTDGTAHIQMYNANAGSNADMRFTQLNDARTSYMSNCTPSDAATGVFFDITKGAGHFIFCQTISGGARSMGIGTIGTGSLVLGVANKKHITIDGPTRATKIEATDATTNAVFDLLTLAKNSTGAGAIGLGVRVLWTAKSSTTEATEQAAIETSWVTATHASRKARVKFSAYDSTGPREVIRIEANGTTPLLGFYGVAAVAMPAALTAQSTSITHTAPGTPDYAIQALTNSGGYGFATQDEGHTLLSVVANLQTRVGELETKLRSLGLLT